MKKFDQLINQCINQWEILFKQKIKNFAIGSPGGPKRNFFHFFNENKKVVKWCIGAPRGPIGVFLICFRKIENDLFNVLINENFFD